MRSALLRTVLFGAAALVATRSGIAEAKKFTVIHNFVNRATDGAVPYGGVAPDGHGGFYVATLSGGESDDGALTLIKKDGSSQLLHSFTGGGDGLHPVGTPYLWPLDGNVYGTTQEGGASNCGTIYRYLRGSETYQQVYALGCAPEGDTPEDALTDVGGVLEATTSYGGPSNVGALIFVRSDGSTGTGCNFSGSNGAYPNAAIIQANGNSYTVAQGGGLNGDGTITKFQGVTCNTSVLHNFAGGSDGQNPNGSLLFYKNALYGTTVYGGTGTNLGTVFKIGLDGAGYTILHVFQGICCGNSDGSFPEAGLALNPKDGMLYGTTYNGGNSSDFGTIFKIDPDIGAETVVHDFSGNDGAHPDSSLYIDKKGKIYGTTPYGGAAYGVVFRLKT